MKKFPLIPIPVFLFCAAIGIIISMAVGTLVVKAVANVAAINLMIDKGDMPW